MAPGVDGGRRGLDNLDGVAGSMVGESAWLPAAGAGEFG
jgi:hypothetical protein